VAFDTGSILSRCRPLSGSAYFGPNLFGVNASARPRYAEQVTTSSAESKRIVVRASGANHDLVVAAENPLGTVLAAIGVQLGAHEQLLGPDGAAVDPATRASDLSEGSVYSVASVASTSAKGGRGSRRSSRNIQTGSLWGLALLGFVAGVGALTLEHGWLRVGSAIAFGVFGLLLALVWSLRADAKVAVVGLLVPLGFGAIAAVLAVPQRLPDSATLAVAAAAFSAAVLASIIGVLARDARPRAGAWAAAAVLLCAGGIALSSRLLEWSLSELAIVLSAASVLAIRALPALMLIVDDGYHVDYQRFMALRWTVRGRMPEYVSQIDSSDAARLVQAAEARLGITLPLLSIIAVAGMPAMVQTLGSDSLLERVCAGVVFVCCVLGLLLVSRRTAHPGLRRAPRLAVVVGLSLSVVVAAGVFQNVPWHLLFGGLMLAAGVVAAAIAVPLAGGSRSLSWSRTGDIVESIAIALVVPASLLAAGTFDTLRGVIVA